MVLPPIIYEDDELVAFDKPSGLAVAPDRRHAGTANLMTLVRDRLGRQVTNVHRLDAETSGVLLCARTKTTLDFLSGQFQARSAEKTFYALVVGAAARDEFTVDLALQKDDRQPGMMQRGRPALTEVRVLERFRGYSWLECRPRTERPHQVRVHLASSGLPVLNDRIYGVEAPLLLSHLKRGYKGRAHERPLLDRLALHAGILTVIHPRTREPVSLRAPLPGEFVVALKYLRRFARARRSAAADDFHPRPEP